jgi:hypothetical protein
VETRVLGKIYEGEKMRGEMKGVLVCL